jgi:hypothetical protein
VPNIHENILALGRVLRAQKKQVREFDQEIIWEVRPCPQGLVWQGEITRIKSRKIWWKDEEDRLHFVRTSEFIITTRESRKEIQ